MLQKLRADCEDASSELMLVDEEQVNSLGQQQSFDSVKANTLRINLCRCDMCWANASSMRRQRRQRKSCNPVRA